MNSKSDEITLLAMVCQEVKPIDKAIATVLLI